ncbi:MAG: GTPase HflX [Spirochaetota bacterium]
MDASVNRIKSSTDERAFLLGIRILKINYDLDELHDSLNELKLLVRTAGAVVIDTAIVKREKIDPAYIIGKGYLLKLQDLIRNNKITLVVFDINQLKPAQVRNLEEVLKCRVVSRTEIIFDIFAKRARSAEAHIQVELAQLRYILPRLKGLGGALSQTGGGIGTRGPGEKMLETDRRHIVKRISKLETRLKKISNHRSLIRKSRSDIVRGAVVGYTNAGKSTLINKLAKDDLFVEDRLFATLDSFTRIVYLEPEKKVLLTDTVGFIRNLPVSLIESFKSTLEEIKNADFLIHVVELTSKDIEKKIEIVDKELAELQCNNKPTILFFNKSDAVKEANVVLTKYHNALIGSAEKNIGISELKQKISEIFNYYHNSKNTEYKQVRTGE